MKLKRRHVWAAVAAAIIVIALALVLWNPPFISGIIKGGYTAAAIPAKDF